MGEPITPTNNVKLGGVEFEANQATSYGRIPTPAQNAGNYFIDFKNGTRVEYQQQTREMKLCFPMHNDENSNVPIISPYCADRIDGLSVSTADIFSIFSCKNVEIKSGSSACIGTSRSENITIQTSNNDDFIDISNCNNFSIDSGDGKDEIIIEQSSEDIYDSRTIPLPKGEVVMSSEDNLKIRLNGTSVHKLSKDYPRVTTSDMKSVATVQGEGIHNVEQTPDYAFETTKRTHVQEETRDENGNYDFKLISETTEIIK